MGFGARGAKDKLGPVGPVGNWKGCIGGNVGPIEPGFNAADDKNSSNIIHL
ncbi:hypothetical protein Bmyc01_34820 [Bacillus mycoides]|nr:hypothetical protein Bmyc01_34820 [Bacillus mycoides]